MKSPTQMDDAELAWHRKDLKDAIAAMESLLATGGNLTAQPKLSQYLDEQHAVLEEIRRRAHGPKTLAYAGKRMKNPRGKVPVWSAKTRRVPKCMGCASDAKFTIDGYDLCPACLTPAQRDRLKRALKKPI